MRKFFGTIFGGQNTSKFSLERLNQLCDLMERNKIIDENNSEIIIETLRLIAELLVWGDKHNEKFWDLFLERNILFYFLNVLSQPTANHVKKQLIQTLSIMVQNMDTANSLYFLLSNNHMNHIIEHEFDLKDEELLAYYINFLKTISLKFDKSIIQFFFDSYNFKFPLYDQAIKFCDHTDSMIRIAVRTITLNTYSVNDPALHNYIVTSSSSSYFTKLSNFLYKQFILLNEVVLKARENKTSIRNLEDYSADILDHIYYLKDIYNVNIQGLDDVLTKSIIQLSIKQLLNDTLQKKILMETCLYSLAQMFNVFSNRKLLNEMSNILFLKQDDIIIENNENFIEICFKILKQHENNQSLISTCLCLIYSLIVNENIPPNLLDNYGILPKIRIKELRQLSPSNNEDVIEINEDKEDNDFITIILNLIEDNQSKRINTLHLIFRILFEMLFDMSINKVDKLKDNHVKLFKIILNNSLDKCRKYFNEIDIFEFLDYFQLEFSQFQRLFSTKCELLLSDTTVLLSNHLDNIDKMKYDIHLFILIYNLLSSHIVLMNQVLEENDILPLTIAIHPKPEYQVGDEAILTNRETIRCCVTSPQSSPSTPTSSSPTTSSSRKIQKSNSLGSLPSNNNNNNNNGYSRNDRHLFFDDNFLYIVVVDVNRIGYGIVEELINLATLQIKTSEQNRFSMRLISEQKQLYSSLPMVLFDKKLVFDDFKIAKEVKTILENKMEDCKLFKKQQFKKILKINN
ncbi:hypothetical protein ABK040_010049 [Willaertia magna]